MNVKSQAELKKKERVKGGRHSNAGVLNFQKNANKEKWTVRKGKIDAQTKGKKKYKYVSEGGTFSMISWQRILDSN